MKKGLGFFVLFLVLSMQLYGQNLIQNGGFENFASAPSDNDNLTSTLNWDYIDGFPEYYHNNYNNVIGAVPNTGDGVVAIGYWINSASFDGSTQIDVVGTRLSQPMEEGKHYVLSLYVKNKWWDNVYCAGLKIMGIENPPLGISNLSPYGTSIDPETLPGITTLATTPLLNDGEYEYFRICIIPETDIRYLFFKGTSQCSHGSIDDYLYLDDVSLFEEETFDLLGNDTTLCVNETLELNAVFQNAVTTWDDGAFPAVRTIDEAGTYSVFVNAVNPICPIRDTIIVDYNLISIPDNVLINDTIICYGNSLSLDATAPDLFYQWENGSTSSALEVTTPGEYTVTLSNGTCEKKDSVIIDFYNCMECDFYVPNAFSPNYDGINDDFIAFPQCNDIGDFDMKVFNRWGSLVFESDDVNVGWDGNWRGQKAETGVYIYTISFVASEFGQLKSRTISGDITLLRGR